ncbi:MAG: DNA-processing protein DprA [Candidatus Binatus sp.]|uniref:DNA-processing protein DprA n=1 Tax=Candidatus Binatus sp. TaxID=2811406 RepID=UPI00271FEF4C|nr:DNA-processing protein DprA [Candidatus Binatus sp.]MDO8434917.1 DNA-processing protein DprA [Candidatus Binatus sp.]
MPSDDAYWLALRRVHGVGPRTCRLLIDKFGPPEKIFKMDADEIAAAGVARNVARSIVAFNDFESLDKELCELPRIGARLLKWTDPDYPPNLRHIADPPPYLFVRGAAKMDETNCIAIVGARAASDAGRRMAQRLGLELAAKGFVVVSGLARGIDGEAHQGALDAHGATVAVLGCGVDVVYPAEHRKLADAIIEGGGAIVSELSIGTPPMPENFPVRNRILSGLCLGVIIVEAAEKSGSLISARMALEQDRQVFAVPGSPLTGKTRGSNRLLKEGARLVECVEDVIEELAAQLGQPLGRQQIANRAPAPVVEPRTVWPLISSSAAAGSRDTAEFPEMLDANSILQCLTHDDRLHVDSIIEVSGLNAQTVLRLLLELELTGRVAQHPGKLFSLA